MIDLDKLDWSAVDADAYAKLSSSEKLLRTRHSAAHLMASAIQARLPHAKFATGPATKTGFFYDMDLGETSLKLDDLPEIEEAMKELVKADLVFETAELSRADALEYFKAVGQDFKPQIIDRIESETLTLYRVGDFVDLCAGPHVPSTRFLSNARLLNVSRSHWRDEREPSLTRVAGTAWSNPKDLAKYLKFLEEMRRRDHRTRGPELDLFTFHPWAASALWHPNGLQLRKGLEDLWRERRDQYRYLEILNPMLYKPELFECSGHWEHFHDDMFVFNDDKGAPNYALKPMNCPDTMLFFKSRSRSYRDLPLRVAESQVLHRNEPTGAIHGIMRTRNFVQDDAHVFLDSHHIQDEVAAQLKLIHDTYELLGLSYRLHLSTRPTGYMGEIDAWNKAETALRGALDATGKEWVLDEGEGAFYGPKIDVYVTDSLGRDWQCGTIQLDFQLPERFELEFATEDGGRKRPIVIHRAVYGSLERFLGILIEHFDGLFPLWLAPEQAVVLPISEDVADYGREVYHALLDAGIRCEIEERDSLNSRIRAAEKRRIRYLVVVGKREAENGEVAVRISGDNRRFSTSVAGLIEEMTNKIESRELDVTVVKVFSEFETEEASSEEAAY